MPRPLLLLVALVAGASAMENLRFARSQAQMLRGDSETLKEIASKLGGPKTPTSEEDIKKVKEASSPHKDADRLEDIAKRVNGLSEKDAEALKAVAGKLKKDPADCEKEEKEGSGDAHLVKNIAERLMELATKSRDQKGEDANKPMWQKVKELEEKKKEDKKDATKDSESARFAQKKAAEQKAEDSKPDESAKLPAGWRHDDHAKAVADLNKREGA